MSSISEERFELLKKEAEFKDSDIIMSKKFKVKEYFKNKIDTKTIDEKLNEEIILANADIKDLTGGNMFFCASNPNDYIFTDNQYLATANSERIRVSLMHETLHSLTNFGVEDHLMMGHNPRKEFYCDYTGINEGLTQMFAEDICDYRLDENETSYFFLTNTMRVMKILFGEKALADQYFHNNTEFEDELNRITDNNFNDFGNMMSEIVNLSKFIEIEEDEEVKERMINNLEKTKNEIMEINSLLIRKKSIGNPTIQKEISEEINDIDIERELGVYIRRADYKDPYYYEDFYR